ncbi:MAG: hypothetical protein R3C16_08705 [Hyphomonadaceae bacterium]
MRMVASIAPAAQLGIRFAQPADDGEFEAVAAPAEAQRLQRLDRINGAHDAGGAAHAERLDLRPHRDFLVAHAGEFVERRQRAGVDRHGRRQAARSIKRASSRMC